MVTAGSVDTQCSALSVLATRHQVSCAPTPLPAGTPAADTLRFLDIICSPPFLPSMALRLAWSAFAAAAPAIICHRQKKGGTVSN